MSGSMRGFPRETAACPQAATRAAPMPRAAEKSLIATDSIVRGDEAAETVHLAGGAGARPDFVALLAQLPILPFDVEARIEVLGAARTLELGRQHLPVAHEQQQAAFLRIDCCNHVDRHA